MADYSIEVSIPNVGPAGTVDRVIAANDSSAGLRITQTGSGDALLVEDSANPDSTPLVINNLGQIISGSTSAWNATAGLQISSNSSSAPNSNISMRRCSSDTNCSVVNMTKARGSAESLSAVLSGDMMGQLSFSAYDGANRLTVAAIESSVDGVPETNNMPTRLTFSTTAAGSSNFIERMRIGNNGNVGIGTTANAAAILDAASTTKGFLPPRMTTTQRNAISAPPAGLMVYNSTTNKLNFYNGTAWEAVTSS